MVHFTNFTTFNNETDLCASLFTNEVMMDRRG